MYNGFNILEEYNDVGITTADYTHGFGIDDILLAKKTGTTYNFFKNALGSVTEILDQAHNMQNKYRYKAYGGFKEKTENVENRFCFTGREFDNETGLYYLRTRYYNAEIGRFNKKDFFAGFIALPKTLNKYNYCGGNPVNWTDLLGMMEEGPPGKGKIPKCLGGSSNNPFINYPGYVIDQMQATLSAWNYVIIIGGALISLAALASGVGIGISIGIILGSTYGGWEISMFQSDLEEAEECQESSEEGGSGGGGAGYSGDR